MVIATPPDVLDILSEIPAERTSAATPDATSLDTGPVSATADLYRAAIGKVSTDFYQRVFTQFESAERTGPTWNWAAALLTVNWMVFRQLWGAALLYTGAVVVAVVSVLGIGRLVLHWSSPVETGLLALLALLAVVVPGAFGNAWLHSASRKKMAAALAANTTVPEACAMLDAQASGKPRLIWLALANALLVGATVGISIALPDADRLTPMAQTPAAEPARSVASAPISVVSAPVVSASAVPAVPITAASAPAPAATTSTETSLAATSAPTTPAPFAATTYSTTQTQIGVGTPAVPMAPASPQTADKASALAATTANRFTTREEAPAPGGKKIYINVGLFAKESNAHNARDKLAKAGLHPQEKQVTGTKGTFTRVRVGPFKTMAQAEKAAEKIKGQGLEAVVVRQ